MKKQILFALSLTFSAVAWAFDGTGTKADPYQITSANDLVELSNTMNDAEATNDFTGEYFSVTSDISLPADFTPIGIETEFKGHFDGQNHTITLQINYTGDYCGLFARVTDGSIKNLRTAGSVIGNNAITGALVGYAKNAEISNCANAASVEGKTKIGGLVGEAFECNIERSFNMGAVSTQDNPTGFDYYGIGGLVGFVNKVTINSCYNAGDVSCANSYYYAGGLVGNASNASDLKYCYNVGSVTVPLAGAVVGMQTDCTIEYCYGDAQLFPNLDAINNTSTAFEFCKMLKTSELIASAELAAGNFIGNNDGKTYFHLSNNFANDAMARVSTAAAILNAADNVTAVAHDFTVSDVSLFSADQKVTFSADGTARVNRCKDGKTSSNITISSGDYKREIALTIENNCEVYTKEQTTPQTLTLCSSELPYTFGDIERTQITAGDFDFAKKSYSTTRDLTFVTIDGCDSVVTYTITCYPTPTAKRSSDMLPSPVQVLSGANLQVVIDFTGAANNYSFTADGTAFTNHGKSFYSQTLRNITADKDFTITDLTCTADGHACNALPEDIDTIQIRVVDEVTITTAVNGKGTITDATPTVKADGKGEKRFSIVPADGWYLSKLENNLEEYERDKVTVVDGGLQYAFTPTTDAKLTATFTEVPVWDGKTTSEPLGSDVLLVYTPAELAWVADQANNQSNNFAGKTVILMNNLDMSNQLWTPIASFAGTFNANCKTVSNISSIFAENSGATLQGFALVAGEIEAAEKTVESDYAAITIASKTPLSGGTNSTYVWKRNGEEISGATGATYTIPAGLSTGTYTFTRHATGGCSGDATQATGEYKLTVNAPQNIEFSFNSDGGKVEVTKNGGAKKSNLFSITPNEGFYLDSVLFNGTDWLDSVYVENGQLKLSCIPATGGDLEVKFAKLAAWDGSVRKPFTTLNRDSVFIFIPSELAWIAQQLGGTPAAGNAPALTPYTRNDVDWGSATVVLEENLDCGGIYSSDAWSGTSWTPVGTEAKPFTSIFDGKNHEIKNLYINASDKDYQGLFGKISNTAELKNFAVTFGSVSGNNYVGCVVGYNDGGKIHHCYNMAEVAKATQYAGGIAGYNAGIIEYAYNVGLLAVDKSTEIAGGIAGYNAAGATIQKVYDAADAWNGSKEAGALVGKNDGTLIDSYWDNQMSAAVVGDKGAVDASVVTTPTTQMPNIFADDTENWVTVDGLYPQLKGLDGTNAAYVSVAPVLLPDLGNAHSITKDFNLTVLNDVEWSSPNDNWLDINGDTAKIKYANCFGAEVFVVAKLGNEIKRAKVNIRLEGDFKSQYIDTKTDTACSVAEIKYISGIKPTGGNSDTYVYRWSYSIGDNPDKIVLAKDTTFVSPEREYLPKVTEPGTYHFYREAKDNACEQNYLKSDGVWTLVLLPPFDAGAIKDLGTLVLCSESDIPTLQDSIGATGGNGEISYRWLMDGGEIAGATAANYTPTATQLYDHKAHTFVRQAKDGKCNNWENSQKSVTITLVDEFSAGAIKKVESENICVDGDQATLNVENDKPASGGDGNYTYRWVIELVSVDDYTNIIIDSTSNAPSLSFLFDRTQLAGCTFPVAVSIKRQVHDGLCNLYWIDSEESAGFVIAQNEIDTITLNVCERDFPYTYTFNYSSQSGKGSRDVTFKNPGETQVITDDATMQGCQRTVVLIAEATPTPQVAIVDSLLEVCESDVASDFFVQIEAVSGNPTKYKLLFDDAAFASVTEFTEIPADGRIAIKAVGTPEPRIYTASLVFLGGTESCESEARQLQLSISIDGYLHQKWNDVIVVNNSGTLEGKPLTFMAYQWYRNGQKVDDATLQHIYEPLDTASRYFVDLIGNDGHRYRTCEFKPELKEERQNVGIEVYPVPARPSENIVVDLNFDEKLLSGGSLEICNAQGLKLFVTSSVETEMTINQHFTQGFYIVRFVDADGEEHLAKFIVK